MTEPRVVERFKKRTIWLHWIHTAAFLVLIVTGAILFFPGLGEAAAGGPAGDFPPGPGTLSGQGYRGA